MTPVIPAANRVSLSPAFFNHARKPAPLFPFSLIIEHNFNSRRKIEPAREKELFSFARLMFLKKLFSLKFIFIIIIILIIISIETVEKMNSFQRERERERERVGFYNVSNIYLLRKY